MDLDIKEYKPECLASIINLVEKFDGWIFRGHRKESWELIPKIARDKEGNYLKGEAFIDKILFKEKKLINEFKLRMVRFNIDIGPGYSKEYPYHKQEWLPIIIGQHYGLPTRLLDFTQNPLVACYFAVQGNSDEKSVVWCIKINTGKYKDQYKLYYDNLPGKSTEEYSVIIPAHIDDRVIVQSGCFVHICPPNKSLLDMKDFKKLNDSDCKVDVKKIVIKNNDRGDILNSLDRVGINEERLFPDLSGTCNYLRGKY